MAPAASIDLASGRIPASSLRPNWDLVGLAPVGKAIDQGTQTQGARHRAPAGTTTGAQVAHQPNKIVMKMQPPSTGGEDQGQPHNGGCKEENLHQHPAQQPCSVPVPQHSANKRSQGHQAENEGERTFPALEERAIQAVSTRRITQEVPMQSHQQGQEFYENSVQHRSSSGVRKGAFGISESPEQHLGAKDKVRKATEVLKAITHRPVGHGGDQRAIPPEKTEHGPKEAPLRGSKPKKADQ
mmetsp:Transcript_72344/g.172780  ORF Transcript_72344/g.172780 Transcript_72344/m.172780 type:complete len:241 (-) Transcript_72344:854-1576(-)